MKGVKGKVYTDFVLNNFRGWFEESAKSVKLYHQSIHLYNAVSEGADIESFEAVSADKLMEIFAGRDEIDRERFFRGIDKIGQKAICKVTESLAKVRDFIGQLPGDEGMFSVIEASEFGYLGRYFMKEKMVYERYGKVEPVILERKLKRLQKNIDGVLHACR